MRIAVAALIGAVASSGLAAAAATHAWLVPAGTQLVAQVATPVLYTPDFPGVFGGRDGNTLKLDDYGQVDELEFVALPGTLFSLSHPLLVGGRVVYRVTTADYPYPTEKGYYIDSRFVRTVDNAADRVASLPAQADIIAALQATVGLPYVWGGNVPAGVPQLLSWYAPSAALPAAALAQWALRGVDCSGLLYHATGGYTPRNTSSLLAYGVGLPIAGQTAEQIAAQLQPLDILAWGGHVVIVLDAEHTIESKADYKDGGPNGVRIRPTLEVVRQILETRTPVDVYDKDSDTKQVVARRWYPAQQS